MQPPPLLLRLRFGVASPVKPHPLLLANSASLPRCHCRRSRFSNAEPGGPAGDDASNTRSQSRSRRWWSDADDQLEDDEFDDGGGFGGAAGELFDEPWFSKVFKAYGYVLPVILASMLVATGPQAFLIAMAIPLAQSAISFALRTLSTAFRSRDQQDYYYSDYADDFEASSSSSSYSYRDSSSSWSQEPAESKPPAGDASSSSSNTKTQSAGFGGWDELDGDDHRSRWSSSSSKSNDDAASASASAVRRSRMRPTSSVSRMGNSRYRQAPLMMRLLVAVFPFLGSWFRML